VRIAIVTCKDLPEPDPDQSPLLTALAHAGQDAQLLPWDDLAADPAPFDLCLLRSTWNYCHEPERFLDWIDHAANVSNLLNPPDVVRWNIHKKYLTKLADQGVPIVPTHWLQRGDTASLQSVMEQHGWDDVVVKPAISAASFLTKRFAKNDVVQGASFLADLLTQRDMMVQKFMPEVDTTGELSITWIDGRFTHAIRKAPRFDDADENVSGAREIVPVELAAAARALAGFENQCLYARVDFIGDPEQGLLLSELELIEPSLFLIQHQPALERLVSALARFAHAHKQ